MYLGDWFLVYDTTYSYAWDCLDQRSNEHVLMCFMCAFYIRRERKPLAWRICSLANVNQPMCYERLIINSHKDGFLWVRILQVAMRRNMPHSCEIHKDRWWYWMIHSLSKHPKRIHSLFGHVARNPFGPKCSIIPVQILSHNNLVTCSNGFLFGLWLFGIGPEIQSEVVS